MFNQSILLFLTITLIFVYWGYLAFKFGIQKIYFLYYGLNFLVFYGPLLYYKIGFTAYSGVVTNESLFKFSIIGFFVVIINILFFKNYSDKNFHQGFRLFFTNAKAGIVNKSSNLKNFYLFIILILLLYIIIYFKNFPLVALFTDGEIGERLDASGAIPFYITFSAIGMVFVPSAFLYYKEVSKNKILILFLFLFTIFILTAGGNKGIVSFFLIFYVLVSSKKVKVFNLLIIFFSLIVIYAVTKGITSYNASVAEYLLESPFRRLFATQGVAFIGRLKMLQEGAFMLNSDWSIKHQVYSQMYYVPIGYGSAPTHFMGNILVMYGDTIMWIVYLLYLFLFVRILFSADSVFKGGRYAYILWNFFIVIFLTTMTDISVSNVLRLILVVIHLIAINILPRLNNG